MTLLNTAGVPEATHTPTIRHLSRSDLDTIHRFHHRFISDGLALKFESTGRSPRSYYPTYRDLLLETDRVVNGAVGGEARRTEDGAESRRFSRASR